MGTVDKALALLGHFSLSHPLWGLSELARTTGNDKATTLRLLRSLRDHRMIEQDSETKKYRIGPAFLNLARIREESFPLSSVLQGYLKRLSDQTGETAHASIPSKFAMSTIGVSEPKRSTRVYVDPSDPLPLHATASGIVFMAFGPPKTLQQYKLSGDLAEYTKSTPTDWNSINNLVSTARNHGFAVASDSFEDETVGVAVPIFSSDGQAQAALAVVSPTMRMSEELLENIKKHLFEAAVSASAELGVRVPAEFEKYAKGHGA